MGLLISARTTLSNTLRALGLPCALCGQPIDYSLPAGDPMSFEVDEIVPVSLGGDELDWRNLQPTHRICNERKGNRVGFRAHGAPSQGPHEPGAPAVRPSQDWSR